MWARGERINLRRLCVLALTLVLAIAGASARAQEEPPPRRRPGQKVEQAPAPLPPPQAYATPPDLLPVPDRWRIVESIGVKQRWYDPYNQNTWKADRPLFDDWFLSLGAISDTLAEARRLPASVGNRATSDSGNLDVFGDGDQVAFNQSFILSASLLKGDTVFRPPDHELRLTVVPNVNLVAAGERGLVDVDPDEGTTRSDGHVGIQELFYDKHLRNKSAAYDFDSLRIGIQPFNSDFRGFLFVDNQPGVRLFGNFQRNRIQYNLAWFRRLEKDTNSGLNTVFDLRNDDVFVANAYVQDLFNLGFQGSALLLYNRNTEGERSAHYNQNGFLERPAPIGLVRPHSYDVVYVGAGGDGHLGRVNLTSNVFLALGHDSFNPIAQRSQTILAYLLAAEGSVDFDWYRLKLFAYHASGDGDPEDGNAHGFDAVFENPNFAGAATSFWQRQALPLVAGGGVILSAREALLPALRTSKEEGQSNFVNPGLILAGIGADFDLYPELRLLTNASYLAFADTATLKAVRQQAQVGQTIGGDLSAALIYRPLFIENIVLTLSAAGLIPGAGLLDLYDKRYTVFYSSFLNVILTY